MILSGCEEATGPQDGDNSDFFPMEIGNYWIYESYEKDINNNIIYSSLIEDSIVIEKSETVSGMTAYKFVKYSSEKAVDTILFSKNGNIIYRLFDTNSIDIPGLNSTWFPIADFNMTMNGTWNIYKQLVNNFFVQDDGGSYSGTYRHAINGEFVYMDSIEFEKKKYLHKNFTNKYDSKLEYDKFRKLSESKFDTIKVTRLKKYFDSYEFLEGAGIFKIKRDSYAIFTSTEPSSTFEKVEYEKGFESYLKRYKLK
jgi:hypothetical protein